MTADIALVFATCGPRLELALDAVHLIPRASSGCAFFVGGTMISATETVSAARVEYLIAQRLDVIQHRGW